jgi:hypothetical protein
MHNRRKVRFGLKVIHRHRIGSFEFRRVSELVYVRGRPKAILGWIDVGGVRTPIHLCDLDPAKLRKAAAGNDANQKTYYYDAVTIDPRYEDLAAVNSAANQAAYRGPERRTHGGAYSGMNRRNAA